jgi:hypothetical protein
MATQVRSVTVPGVFLPCFCGSFAFKLTFGYVVGPVPHVLTTLFNDDTTQDRQEGPVTKWRKISEHESVPGASNDVFEVERNGVAVAELDICLVRYSNDLIILHGLIMPRYRLSAEYPTHLEQLRLLLLLRNPLPPLRPPPLLLSMIEMPSMKREPNQSF